MPHYLVVTFSDKSQADAAYAKLEAAQLALAQLEIAGSGYKSLQELNVYDPNQVGWKQSTSMLFWLVPFGFAAGFCFNSITQLSILEQSSALTNHLIGGILGAASGAMGGFTFGGGLQFLFDRDKQPLGKRIQSGKYLLIAQGTELLVRQACRILQGVTSDSLQLYEGLS